MLGEGHVSANAVTLNPASSPALQLSWWVGARLLHLTVAGSFHCLFCHGFEERGVPSAGILAIDDVAAAGPAVHLARQARALVAPGGKVTIYTNGPNEALATAVEAGLASLEKSSVAVDTRRIKRLAKAPTEGSEVVIHFAGDGDAGAEGSKTEGFLVHKPKMFVNGPFAPQLGLQMTPDGDIQTVSPMGATDVKGVFVAGDCGNKMKTVTNAISTASVAAAMVSAFVQAEAAKGDPKLQ